MNTIDLEKILENIDITKDAPVSEPQRQYYFIKKMRGILATLEQEKGRKLTASAQTFGCQMNAKDSEKLIGILREIGFEIIEDESADLVFFNTCTVRDNANPRVYGRLGYLNSMKKKNPDKKIALCGCMMQEPSVIEKIQKSYSFVDLIFGTHNIFKFAELLTTMYTSDRMVIDIWKDTDQIVEDLPSERKFAFKCGVNIMYFLYNFYRFLDIF